MRWVLILLVYLASVVVLAPICFFAVVILAGPHSSILPGAIQPAILIAGWVIFLGLPIYMARRFSKRWKKQ